MRLILPLLFLLFLLSLSACKKYKPADAAFFITPSIISVHTGSVEGSASHKITDLGLYVDGQFMGSYPAGNRLPIVTRNNSVRINILAGIKNNGISDTRVFWPMYESIQIDTFVTEGLTINRPLTFRYASGVTFTWTENFDSGTGHKVIKSNVSDTSFTIEENAAGFEGKYLRMAMSGRSIIAQVESSGSGFSLPQGSTNVYLELNYRCSDILTVGLLDASLQQRPVLHLNPQNNWNKIYIPLADAVNLPSYSSSYKVYFRMLKSASVPNTEFSLDNIKLVYL